MEEDKEFGEKENEEALSEEEVKKLYNRIQSLLRKKVKTGNNGKVNGKTPAQKKQEKKSRKINQKHARQARKFTGKNHRNK